MTAPDPRLLALLVCPMTRSALAYDPDRQLLVAARGGRAYPVRDGVPELLPDAGGDAPGAAVSQARP